MIQSQSWLKTMPNRFNTDSFKRLTESRLQVFLKYNTWTSKVLLTWIMTEGVLIHCRTVHFQEADWSRLQVFLLYNATWTSFLFVNLKPITTHWWLKLNTNKPSVEPSIWICCFNLFACGLSSTIETLPSTLTTTRRHWNHSLHPYNNAPTLKPCPPPLDMNTTTQQQAIYRPQPLVGIHRRKDFEGADEKIFSPAYAHQYILLIAPARILATELLLQRAELRMAFSRASCISTRAHVSGRKRRGDRRVKDWTATSTSEKCALALHIACETTVIAIY